MCSFKWTFAEMHSQMVQSPEPFKHHYSFLELNKQLKLDFYVHIRSTQQLEILCKIHFIFKAQ